MPQATLVPAEEWALGPEILGQVPVLIFGFGFGNLSMDMKVSLPLIYKGTDKVA